MSHGGMSPRGGLSDTSAGAETGGEGEPAPFAGAHDLAEAPVRVTLAETRAQLLRSFIMRGRDTRGETGPSSVDALLDSMEAAGRGVLVRTPERQNARASDDAFSFGRVVRSGSAQPEMFGAGFLPSNDAEDVDGSPNEDSGPGNAANAHDGVSDSDAFGIDTRVAAKWLEHTVPICVILLVSFLLARVASLGAFIWTTAVFLKANDLVKRGVSIGVRVRRPIDVSVNDFEANGGSRRNVSPPTSSAAGAFAETSGETASQNANLADDDGKDDLRESLNEKRRFVRLVAALTISGGAIGCLHAVFPYEPFWDAFFFRAPYLNGDEIAETKSSKNDDSFLDFLWRAAMADLLARLFTVCVKACVLIVADAEARRREAKKAKSLKSDENKTPRGGTTATRARFLRAARLKRRAESCQMASVENVSLLVRTAMPVATWFFYFMRHTYVNQSGFAGDGVLTPNNSYESLRRLGACFAAGAYLAIKIKAFVERFHALRTSTLGFWEIIRKDPTGLGMGARESSAAEILAAGNECTVCCDAFEFPVTLTCGHLFCEKCVGAWFERSRACPLCRAVVAGKHCGVVEHGDGATVAWPYAF